MDIPTPTKLFVCFFFHDDPVEIPIAYWSVEDAIRIAEASFLKRKPFGFKFKEKTFDSNKFEIILSQESNNYYLGGTIYLKEEIEKRIENGENWGYTLDNMNNNRYNAVIRLSTGVLQEFENNAILLRAL